MSDCLITRRGGETKKVPVLNKQYPEDVTTVADGSEQRINFAVNISEPGNPQIYSYQWYVDGEAVDGATGDTYNRDISADKGVYTVWCEVTNKAGTVRTREAVLTVNRLPVLDESYPQNATMKISESTKLEVRIAEDGFPSSYTYQWYRSSGAISGATSPTYTYTSMSKGTETFYCVVTSDAGSVQSRMATITKTEYWLYKDGTAYVEMGFVNPVAYAGLPLNGNYAFHGSYAQMVGNGNGHGHALYAWADVTKFSKLCVLMTMTGEDLLNGGIWAAEHSNYQHNGAVVMLTFDRYTQYTSGTVKEISVQNLSGGKYLVVGSWSATHDLRVYRMWLE